MMVPPSIAVFSLALAVVSSPSEKLHPEKSMAVIKMIAKCCALAIRQIV
jgi:hypothetical protein